VEKHIPVKSRVENTNGLEEVLDVMKPEQLATAVDRARIIEPAHFEPSMLIWPLVAIGQGPVFFQFTENF